MKKIDTSFITTTAGLSVKSGVLNHLMQAYQEVGATLARNMVGAAYDPTKVYIIYGCINSGAGLSYIISAGAVYYNGEVYLVDAISFVAASGQVAVGLIDITFATSPTGDPVEHTDGASHNVLQIRKVSLLAAGAGTGALPDFSSWIPVNSASMQNLLVAAVGSSYTIGFTQDQAVFFTTGLTSGTCTINWDFTAAIPGSVARVKIAASISTNITFATPGGAEFIIESGAFEADKTNIIYAVYLGKNSTGNHEVSYKIITL